MRSRIIRVKIKRLFQRGLSLAQELVV